MLECQIYNRTKDVGSSTEAWFSELLSSNPWFAKVVPKVRMTEGSKISLKSMFNTYRWHSFDLYHENPLAMASIPPPPSRQYASTPRSISLG